MCVLIVCGEIANSTICSNFKIYYRMHKLHLVKLIFVQMFFLKPKFSCYCWNTWVSSLSWNRKIEITLKTACTLSIISTTFSLMKEDVRARSCVTSHLHLSFFVKVASHLYLCKGLTSINLYHSQCARCRSASWIRRICFMPASYWIWISFVILFLILKVTLAFVLLCVV